MWAQTTETFYLKGVEKVIGTVLEINDSTGVYTIESAYGTITFNQSDIEPTVVEVSMKSGEMIKGELIKEDELSIVIKSSLGVLTLAREKINSITFPNSEKGTTLGKSKESSNSGRWYYGDERLIDVFFDPTVPRNRHGIQLLEQKPESIGEKTWGKVVALIKQHVPASRDVPSSLTEINFSKAKRKRAVKDGRESD